MLSKTRLNKKWIVRKNPNGQIDFTDTELMERLHGHGLKVFSWTFRNEYDELSSWDDGQDPYVEYQRFLDAGLDGYFTDFPGSLKRFFNEKENRQMIGSINGHSGSNCIWSTKCMVSLFGLVHLIKLLF